MEGSIEGEFCFGDCTRVVQSVVPEMSAAQLEEKFWDDAKAAENKEGFEGYLESYPKGRYVRLARANIARLSTANVQIVSAPPIAQEAAKLAADKACLACHAIDKKVVGPAFKDVAAKYKGNAKAEALLVQKVLKGGVGAWGQIPMPANASLKEDEAKLLVKWVLGQ
jgi:cytochrome c